MRGFLITAAIVLSAIAPYSATYAAPKPAAVAPPVSARDLQLAFYDYDKTIALNTKSEELPNKSQSLADLRTRYRVEFDSAHDQRVTAIYSVPKRFAPPYPAVVLLAGSGGHKDSDYVRIAADMMCTLGYATISLDAQYHGDRARPERSGDFHIITNTTSRDAWVQTVIDLRRAVDFLQAQKEVDRSKIGYIGFSQGSLVGGVFIGVEPRIKCACLAVGGGGLIPWSKKLGFWQASAAKELQDNAAVCDPVYFIGRFAPKPLLMLSAKRDEMIPKAATMTLYNAAGGQKKLVWFSTGHVLPPNALVGDARTFFITHLGARKETKGAQ
ncbi:MAG: acetylxylan esterase [Methanobacterium paludis]|nr:acetylxylan esterase [Methanobacterium paludis]